MGGGGVGKDGGGDGMELSPGQSIWDKLVDLMRFYLILCRVIWSLTNIKGDQLSL